MERLPERLNFPETEEEILKFWKDIDAFRTSLKQSEGKPEYTFYDGPPFATGLPHYGHILAGTMKDIVTRYAHQTGHHVSRRFGWDCHGLPIEFEIDKQLGIKTKEEVLALGIPKYNAACRSIVMRYSKEWENVVNRMGRWIDFENDYKTLDASYMESVWWVFKTIYEKDMVYRGFKVMPYSTGCTTPLSNFEANLAYKDVTDPAVIVRFPLVEDDTVSFIAWTTTPWTLPSNMALCVNPDFEYVKVRDVERKQTYIMMFDRLSQLYKEEKEYEILERFKGKTLEGKKYTPLFQYFVKSHGQNAFRIMCDGYVTNESGTGIVHCAPAFGEDDYRVCIANNIVPKADLPCPVDDNGRFLDPVTEFKGKHVKEADSYIIKDLQKMDRLVHRSQYKHSYPFCWRSDTPLIYKAVPSWFVAVEKIRDKLVANNKKTYWVPEFVQEKRFHNWLADARDWAVSRNRYWGCPLPVWISDDGEERVVIGSIAELEQLSGVKVTDLHRENVDGITIPSKKGKGVLRRVEEVFDCWFESGSMPYAQIHYPFENKEKFENGFPADFIAEGIDQTRGWFYTLLVLSTALFEKPAFKNLIVNGLVLAADGKKMSKRLKNYPDPVNVMKSHGADALRLYLINSPVVRGETLRFQEKGVRDLIKDVFLPWYHACRFFFESTTAFNGENTNPLPLDVKICLGSTNVLDKWILAATASLIKFVREEMAAYRLYTVVPRLLFFIEQLTNWYIKLNRKRLMKGSGGQEDWVIALNTLFEVLITIVRAMSPFTPFIAEYFYQKLKTLLPEAERQDSAHYLMFPEFRKEALNDRIEQQVSRMQEVISLGRFVRERQKQPLKQPLKELSVISANQEVLDDCKHLQSYIVEELNIRSLTVTTDESQVTVSAKANFQKLGAVAGKQVNQLNKEIMKLKPDQIAGIKKTPVTLLGFKVTYDDLVITRTYSGKEKTKGGAGSKELVVVLNCEQDDSLEDERIAREFMNRVQRLRKKCGLSPSDCVEIFFKTSDTLTKQLERTNAFVSKGLDSPLCDIQFKSAVSGVIVDEEHSINNVPVHIWLCRRTFRCSKSSPENIARFVALQDFDKLDKIVADHKGSYNCQLDGQQYHFTLGKDLFKSAYDAFKKSS